MDILLINKVEISPEELKSWSRYIHQISGIHLDESKAYLIETRLRALMKETRSTSWIELLIKIKGGNSIKYKEAVINAITTRETSFFRDSHPFTMLGSKLIPDVIRKRRVGIKSRPLIRILSVACSTGQEVYSIAMTLKEYLKNLDDYDLRIVGIDISEDAINYARKAQYTKREIERGLTPDRIQEHFEVSEDFWTVKEELRKITQFSVDNVFDLNHNLGPFDIIFCRNLAIYFTEKEKKKLFKLLSSLLNSDGKIIIGSTETVSRICPEMKMMKFENSNYYHVSTNHG